MARRAAAEQDRITEMARQASIEKARIEELHLRAAEVRLFLSLFLISYSYANETSEKETEMRLLSLIVARKFKIGTSGKN